MALDLPHPIDPPLFMVILLQTNIDYIDVETALSVDCLPRKTMGKSLGLHTFLYVYPRANPPFLTCGWLTILPIRCNNHQCIR